MTFCETSSLRITCAFCARIATSCNTTARCFLTLTHLLTLLLHARNLPGCMVPTFCILTYSIADVELGTLYKQDFVLSRVSLSFPQCAPFPLRSTFRRPTCSTPNGNSVTRPRGGREITEGLPPTTLQERGPLFPGMIGV